MGTILPDNPRSQVEFFQTRAAQWVASAADIGLSDQQAADVAAATAAAAEAWRRAAVAREAARNATLEWEFAAKKLREVGGQAIRSIKSYAAATDQPGVYSAASLDRPNRPGPKHRSQDEADAALPSIRCCRARPDALGGVEIEWMCGQGATMGAGAGMFYRVKRSLDGGESVLLEVVGSPGPGRRSVRFTDVTVPAGTRTAEYIITPMRGGATGRPGPSATVRFGGVDSRTAASIRRAA